MEKFEYDGDIYYFANNKFYDEHFIQVDKITLDKISHEYTKNIDYKSLNMDELFEKIRLVKDLEMYGLAKEMAIYGIGKFCNDLNFIRPTVSILTSCLRLMGKPSEAIEIAIKYMRKYNFKTVPILTSLAAAYCDIKDYDRAIKCANLAYAMQGGGTGYKNELSLVYKRIQKEKDLK